jgi:hypothetical protein
MRGQRSGDGGKIGKWRAILEKWRNLREFSLFFTIFHVKSLLYTKYFGLFHHFVFFFVEIRAFYEANGPI